MTRRLMFGSLLAYLALTSACVQILGLEDAELEMAGTGGTGGGGSSPQKSCAEEPVPTCEECLANSCDGEDLDCAADAECRTELDMYAYCLGKECDHDSELCVDALRPSLRPCVLGCGSACAGTKLLSECALYCACMSGTCAAEMLEACMADCEQLPAEVTHCRHAHCNAATANTGAERTLHCQHASDTIPICSSYLERPEEDREVCLDRAESTWPCSEDTECCSDLCLDGACD